jgi:HAD superfamily hydrolase (TIGR01509 family)
MTLQALIFDVDGTLAETEEIHREAFNRAFLDAGLDWYWDCDRYRELLAVTGGRERIRHAIEAGARIPMRLDDLEAWIAELHRVKTRFYAESMATGKVSLRPGVERLLREAREGGLRLAIATTTSMPNVVALLDATLGQAAFGWFDVIATAEQAPRKKPDPSVYTLVLARLGLPPDVCIAIEDSANGVKAARAAGLPVMVTESRYSAGEDFTGAFAVLDDLGEPTYTANARVSDVAGAVCVDVAWLRRRLATVVLDVAAAGRLS